MMSNKWLVQLGGGLVAAVLLVGGGYYKGYSTAKHRYQAQVVVLQQRHSAEALAAEQAYTAKLAEAAAEKQKWYDFAQNQSAKLADALRKLDTRQGRLQQEIPNAIEQDKHNGGCTAGLGAHSLQLYRQALGYAD